MDLAECAKWELLESVNNSCILNVRFWHKADIHIFHRLHDLRLGVLQHWLN